MNVYLYKIYDYTQRQLKNLRDLVRDNYGALSKIYVCILT